MQFYILYILNIIFCNYIFVIYFFSFLYTLFDQIKYLLFLFYSFIVLFFTYYLESPENENLICYFRSKSRTLQPDHDTSRIIDKDNKDDLPVESDPPGEIEPKEGEKEDTL